MVTKRHILESSILYVVASEMRYIYNCLAECQYLLGFPI